MKDVIIITFFTNSFRRLYSRIFNTENAGFIGEESYFYDVHSTIVKTLNNLFNKKQLENANEHLKEIYLKDILTGVYNRVAFTQKLFQS